MKKKVLFVINTMGRAGAERCLLHLFHAWKDDQTQLYLFSVLDRGELFGEVPDHVKILNRNPVQSSVFDGNARKSFKRMIAKGLFFRGMFFRQSFFLLRLLIWQIKNKKVDGKKLCWKLVSDAAQRMDEEFDLAVGYLQGAATYYVMDHVKAKKKIVFLHNEYEASGYCKAVDSPYYEQADRIYCVADNISNALKDIFPNCKDKIRTLYNFTDPEWVKQRSLQGKPEGMEVDPNTICLLTAARLEPLKAYDVAVKTMTVLKEKGVRAKWYVLGDGSLRGEIEKEIKTQGVEDCFFLLGLKENPYPYIAACDIYVQETRYEGFCTSITEAVILGKKVVASDCGGNREQLSFYGTGILTGLTPKEAAEGIIRAYQTDLPVVDVTYRQEKELERLKAEL